MDLTSYVSNLGREFATLAEAGGDGGACAGRAPDRVARVGDPDDAAGRAVGRRRRDHPGPGAGLGRAAPARTRPELRRDLATAERSARGRGRAATADGAPDGDLLIAEDGPAARINVRLPEQLKAAIEEAAAKEGRSVNAWLVRAAAAALQRPDREQRPEPRGSGKRTQQGFTGWVR